MEYLADLWDKITVLGSEHNVNPILFAILYFASIPPYMGSMVWAVRNNRKGKSINLPVISTLFFFIMPALYVAIFGRNVAWWVYLTIVFLIIYSTHTVRKKITSKLEESESSEKA
ncbi:MAG: hypothetical protein ED557_02275 [Balneola sp.]|nr:MAG: hypothetical protein ED557_02275 [Balneola sp.]